MKTTSQTPTWLIDLPPREQNMMLSPWKVLSKSFLQHSRHQDDNVPYSLRELVLYMCDYEIRPRVFKLPVENGFDLLKDSSAFTVACSCKTLQMKIPSTTRTVNSLI
jgi:hypothetical protein